MGRKRKYNIDDKTIIYMYIDMHLSLHQIKERTGIHYEIIRRRLKQLGITIRDKSESMYNYWKHKKQ